MSKIRVAIFDQFMPTHYDYNQPDMLVDEPSDWATSLGGLKFSQPFEVHGGKRFCRVEDTRLQKELYRLTKFQTCPICRNSTTRVESFVEDENIQLCLGCGYWGGLDLGSGIVIFIHTQNEA